MTDINTFSEEYLSSALMFGKAQREPDFRTGNKFAERLEYLGPALRASEEGRRQLLRLMEHPDLYVQLWAARDCLPFSPEAAAIALRKLGSEKGLLATSAQITLSEWESGRLVLN